MFSRFPAGRANRSLTVASLALLVTTGLFGCDLILRPQRFEEETEKQALETGDTLLKETYIVRGRDIVRVNKYSLQFGDTEKWIVLNVRFPFIRYTI